VLRHRGYLMGYRPVCYVVAAVSLTLLVSDLLHTWVIAPLGRKARAIDYRASIAPLPPFPPPGVTQDR
jgi:hypothetical protein